MRIISQNKVLSFDFDRSILRMDDECISVRMAEGYTVIGTYKTANRAEKIWKDIHDAYIQEMMGLPYVTIFEMPEE